MLQNADNDTPKTPRQSAVPFLLYVPAGDATERALLPIIPPRRQSFLAEMMKRTTNNLQR